MKVNKLFSIIAVGALALGAFSCTDEVKYDPAAKVEGEGICFDATIGSEMEIPTDATEIPITMSRSTKTGDYTVDITSSVTYDNGDAVEGVFTLPKSVTFKDGELTAVYSIGLDFAAVQPDVAYHLSLALPEGLSTPYGPDKVETVLIYSPWGPLEQQDGYVSVITGTPFNGNDYEQAWGKAESLVDENQWLVYIPTPFSNVPGLEWVVYINTNESRKMEVDGQEVYWVTTDVMDTGYERSDGTTYGLSDAYSWYVWQRETRGLPVTEENTAAFMEELNLEHSYFNPVTGMITLNVMLSVGGVENAGRYYTPPFDPWYIQLPGYTAPVIMIQDLGNYVDATGYETKQFGIVTNEVVEGFKYKLLDQALEGEALDAAMDVLLKDESIEPVTDQNIELSYELVEGHDYTLLAIGLNSNGAISCSDSKVFTYHSIQRPDGFTTVGMVNFTDGVVCDMLELGEAPSFKVELQKSETEEGLYRIKNPYRDWAKENKLDKLLLKGNYYIYINASDPKMVYIPESSLGLQQTLQQGALNIYSEAARLLAAGRTPAYIKLQKKCGSLKNDVVTFPIGTILSAWAEDIPGWSTVNNRGTFRLELKPAEEGDAQAVAPANVSTRARNAAAATVRFNGTAASMR